MDLFSDSLVRLKHYLRVSKDQEVAEAIGLSKTAFSERKKRNSFPEKELRALAQQRPELGIDVDYVLTGTTEAESLRQRDALHAAGGVSKEERALNMELVELAKHFKACTQTDRDTLLQLAAFFKKRSQG